MLTLNTEILEQVVATAKRNASTQPRWINAIERAASELVNNPYIEALDDHTLLIGSVSGNTYTSNGVCQCQAYQNGKPCYHRAMSRLYQRYVEAVVEAERTKYVCRSCGEKIHEPGPCYACVSRGPVRSIRGYNYDRKETPAQRATRLMNELY